MAEQIKVGMSLDTFIAKFEQNSFELIDNQVYEMTPAKKKHSKISKRIYDRILFYLVDNDIGEVFFETTFIIEDKPNWVAGSRIPDVSFYEQSRLEAHEVDNPDEDDKPFILVPDLVVEVISPTDKYSDVTTKIDAYLSDGVQLIWIIDPQRETVTVYQLSNPKITITLNQDDTLTGYNVLPNFEIAITDIFK